MMPPFLVQVKDAEGFWCNVSEHASPKFACKVAQVEANETGQIHRAVAGPKREILTTCRPVGAPLEPWEAK